MNTRRRPSGQFGRPRGRPPVGQKRALPDVYLTGQKNVIPQIYLPESGRKTTSLKWLLSTCFAGAAGIAAIAISIYVAKDDGAGKVALVDRFKQYGENAMERLDTKFKFAPGLRVARGKTDRIIVSSRGLMTQHVIHDRITQARDGRQFISIKPYARMVVSFATEAPDDKKVIPPFNPFKLYANLSPVGGKTPENAEKNGTQNVSVKVIELVGGILPEEDLQEIPNTEVAKLVAAAGEDYSHRTEQHAAAKESSTDQSFATPPEAPAGNSQKLAIPARTTIIQKTVEQENDTGDVTEIKTVTIGSGDRMYKLLLRAGSETWQASAIITAMNKIYKANDIRAGQKLKFLLTPSLKETGKLEPVQVSLYEGSFHKVTVGRSGSGDYVASESPFAGTVPNLSRSGQYRHQASAYLSLYHAGLVLGLTPKMVMKMLRIHAYDTDFKRFVRQGDGFEAFFDMKETGYGQDPEPGELLYTAINMRGTVRKFYRFRSPDGNIDYYDKNGDSAKKFLMRKPVRSHDARLTSGFGYRFHPVLRRRKMHTGVDWAARRGTPILASGSGTVEQAGRKGGYGKYIRIRHANGYKTAYAHMHRFAKGITKGVKVRQNQVIGYVGTTGRSTGNHLHFEVLVNNRHVNPMTIPVPRGLQLRGRLLTAYKKERDRINELMQRAPVKTRIATAANLSRNRHKKPVANMRSQGGAQGGSQADVRTISTSLQQ